MNNGKKRLIVLTVAEGSLVLLLGIRINHDRVLRYQSENSWILVAGIIFVIGGLLISQNEKFYNWFQDKLTRIGNRLDIHPWQVLLLMTSPIFAAMTTAAAGFETRMYSPIASAAVWLLGIVFALSGCWKFTEEKLHMAKKAIVWFVFVTVLAFLFRGFATGQIPILLTGDEGSAGVNALDFINGKVNNIFINGWFSFPSLFPFIQSISVRILGNTTEALRIPSAFVGALTVGVVYLCGRAMFGQRTGLFAALLLSALHFHVHFSRLGLNNIWDGLWFTLTIGALWYGWKNQARWAYLAAGVGLGFAQYFYTSSRALIVIIVMGGVLAFIFQRSKFRQSWSHFLATLFIAAIIVAPLAWFYLKNPNQFLAPFARVSVLKGDILSTDSGWKFLSQQILTAMGAYTQSNLRYWYSPGTPLLRPVAVVLFYLGCVYLIVKDRDSRLFFLASWLIIFGIISGLSDSPPAAQRYVAAAPACALIAGYGLHKSTDTLKNLWRKTQGVIPWLAYLILLVAMISDLKFYFWDYTFSTRLENLTSNGMIAQQLANYLKDESPDTRVVFSHNSRMGYSSISSTLYLAPQITGIDAPSDWSSFDQSQLYGHKVIFVFLPESYEDIDTIENDCPAGILTKENAWNGETLFWLYECTAK